MVDDRRVRIPGVEKPLRNSWPDPEPPPGGRPSCIKIRGFTTKCKQLASVKTGRSDSSLHTQNKAGTFLEQHPIDR